MTKMSDHHGKNEPDFAANAVRLLVQCLPARVVHDPRVAVGVLLVSLLVGCVIPPSLSVDNTDAGVNSPPAITAVRADDKALFEADLTNPAIFAPGEGSLSVALVDTDVNDTLYVRVFVNYTLADPEGPRSLCTANPIATAKRSVTCDVQAVCLDRDVQSGDTLNMSVVVFDRQPLESGDPPHQAMPDGGLSTSKFFFLKCQEPT
jgi:hypothetical protein